METVHSHVIVQTTMDSTNAADELAAAIVASRLAACVQLVPIRSIYHWQGKVEQADELLLMAKTRRELSDRLGAFIAENHSYEVPEIVTVPIVGGGKPYLAWIDAETAAGKGKADRAEARG